jgi:hypothetical protein
MIGPCWMSPSVFVCCYVPRGLQAGGLIVAPGGLSAGKEALVATTPSEIAAMRQDVAALRVIVEALQQDQWPTQQRKPKLTVIQGGSDRA